MKLAEVMSGLDGILWLKKILTIAVFFSLFLVDIFIVLLLPLVAAVYGAASCRSPLFIVVIAAVVIVAVAVAVASAFVAGVVGVAVAAVAAVAAVDIAADDGGAAAAAADSNITSTRV